MNQKSKKQLIFFGLLILIALFIYHLYNKGSFSGFGFGASGDYAQSITYTNPGSSDGSTLAQPPTNKITIATNDIISMSGTNTIDTGKNAKINFMAAYTTNNTSASTILWLFPTGSSGSLTGISGGTQYYDTLIWPTNITLNSTNLNAFNWYMNQDSINTYMSDLSIDIDYTKVSGAYANGNPNPPADCIAPCNWSGPYVTQSIGNLLYGSSDGNDKSNTNTGGEGGSASANNAGPYNAQQITRTNNLVTVIGNYTNLYQFICGTSGATEKNCGLANIKVGLTTSTYSSGVSATAGIYIAAPGTWKTGKNGTGAAVAVSGAFNDATFYPITGLTKATDKAAPSVSLGSSAQTVFTLNGDVKHAIWSVLLARQTQLIGRLEPTIVATL
jgi:hypothetical protein